MTLILFIYFAGVFILACALDLLYGDFSWGGVLLWPVLAILFPLGWLLDLILHIKEDMQRDDPL